MAGSILSHILSIEQRMTAELWDCPFFRYMHRGAASYPAELSARGNTPGLLEETALLQAMAVQSSLGLSSCGSRNVALHNGRRHPLPGAEAMLAVLRQMAKGCNVDCMTSSGDKNPRSATFLKTISLTVDMVLATTRLCGVLATMGCITIVP